MITVGGAKSSAIRPRYHKIPILALRRLALRFALGEREYDDPAESRKLNGRMNWEEGTEEFWVERYNHAIEHLLLSRNGNEEDDHLAAVMWYCATRMQVEEKRKAEPP